MKKGFTLVELLIVIGIIALLIGMLLSALTVTCLRSPFPGPDDLAFGFTSPSGGTQGFRHRMGTNVAFCDGHAETLYQHFTNLILLDTGTVAPGTEFLSSDNSCYQAQFP